ERLDREAILDGVDKYRRGRNVVVPERMMRSLKVPASLAGFEIHGYDALAVKMGAGPQAPVHIAVRRFDGQIREPELLVRRDRGPDARVAAARLGRAVEPSFIARFAGPRHGMERPKVLAAHDVEATDVADDVLRLVGRRERRRRVRADLARVPVVTLIHRFAQIDDAVFAEALDRMAGLGVQRDEPIARRHVDDALVVAALPEREPAAGKPARRFRAALALVEAKDPELLGRRGVERRHGAPRTGRRVEHAVDHDGRALKAMLGRGTEVHRAEAPSDLQRAEIAR